jgi:hypothetical protein
VIVDVCIVVVNMVTSIRELFVPGVVVAVIFDFAGDLLIGLLDSLVLDLEDLHHILCGVI